MCIFLGFSQRWISDKNTICWYKLLDVANSRSRNWVWGCVCVGGVDPSTLAAPYIHSEFQVHRLVTTGSCKSYTWVVSSADWVRVWTKLCVAPDPRKQTLLLFTLHPPAPLNWIQQQWKTGDELWQQQHSSLTLQSWTQVGAVGSSHIETSHTAKPKGSSTVLLHPLLGHRNLGFFQIKGTL